MIPRDRSRGSMTTTASAADAELNVICSRPAIRSGRSGCPIAVA